MFFLEIHILTVLSNRVVALLTVPLPTLKAAWTAAIVVIIPIPSRT
jgi:hypothetical protein